VTLSKYGKRFGRGRVELEGTTVYVNRGIGMEGGIFPRLRLCSRPEVALIRLVPRASD
jgi:predicted MPP superfamily phosphohydrolase